MAEASRRADRTAAGAEGWAGAAQDAARGAAQKATEGAAYVQDRLEALDDAVQDYTGKPFDEWREDLKTLMRERPLLGAAMMVGVGFAIAKLLRR